MVNLEIKLIANKAKNTFAKILERIDDMNPIWKDFKAFFQTNLMLKSFRSKGALMEGSRWAALTPKYLKWKLSSKNEGSKKLLILSKKMFNATQGGAGWYDKIDKKSMTVGIQGKDYYYWVQHRSKNPRFYFYTKNEDMPNLGWAYLIKIMAESLESADNDK